MTSQRDAKPSLLNRIRGTPRSLRRKLGLSSDCSETSVGVRDVIDNDVISDGGTSKVVGDGFNCRFLGERTVYTLKPEDCYQFALDLSKNCDEKSLHKTLIRINSKSLDVTNRPPTPVHPKHKSKNSSRFTPPSGSPLFPRRPGSARSRNSSGNESPHRQPTTIFDTPYYQPKRMTSVDDLNMLMTPDSPLEMNNNSHNDSGGYFHFDPPRKRSYTFDGCLMDQEKTEPSSTTDQIALHDIAYCVTLPESPRIFLLTTRGREALTCRVLLFARREKAQALKEALAEQFQLSFNEWRAKFTGRRISQDGKPVSSSSSDVSSITDDEALTPEDEAMHREYTRRASCLANPDQLGIVECSTVEDGFLNNLEVVEANGVAD